MGIGSDSSSAGPDHGQAAKPAPSTELRADPLPGRSTRLAQQKLGRIAGRSVLRPSLLNALTTVALGTTALLLGGCGTGQVGGSTDGDAVKVRYESVHEGGESGGTPVLVEVIAAGEKFRMSTADAATPDEVYLTVVWDGDAMLLLEGQEASRQVDPPQEERPTAFILQAGDATFELLCPGGEQDGSAEVAGRAGTVYSCPASNTDGMAGESSQLTLDDATGVLLSRVSASSRMVAVDVDPDVDVDDATFSTEIPPEMRSEGQGGDDGASPLPLTATDGVPLAGGGQLLMEQIRQGPSLVVIGELPGVTAMLAHILPRTDQGTAPPVYVLLNPLPFDEADSSDLPLASAEGEQKLLADVSAQVSDVPVPVGIDIKGGAAGEDLRPFEELMSGTTVLAAIDETGALAWRMTDTELTDSPDQLDDWIAFTT